jgi:membrane protease subunit (stomatin/prohibitin family)
MGPGVLVWHYPDNSIVNNSLLTVESNHFCVLKSRGAILNVYDTGQYPVTTPDRPILGSFTQAFFGGQSPWQYEALYINRAKSRRQGAGQCRCRSAAEVGIDPAIEQQIDQHLGRLAETLMRREEILAALR